VPFQRNTARGVANLVKTLAMVMAVQAGVAEGVEELQLGQRFKGY